MTTSGKRKVILYIAMSADGYIAGPDDDLSFLKLAEAEGEDYGYAAFRAHVDTVILGRRTFDWVVREVGAFPEKEREVYVLTRTPRAPEGNIHFYTGDIGALVSMLRARAGRDIHLDGGGQVIREFLARGLVDELILFVIPVLLGDGTRLFQPPYPYAHLLLRRTEHYPTGVIRMDYSMAP
jgi:dihydrofolate reductase